MYFARNQVNTLHSLVISVARRVAISCGQLLRRVSLNSAAEGGRRGRKTDPPTEYLSIFYQHLFWGSDDAAAA